MRLMCELRNISKSYQVNELTINPIKNVNLKINQGDFLTVEGPSGSGKSTLLSIIGGILVPNSGSVFIKGKNIFDLSEKERTNIRKKHISFVFQKSSLIETLTVRENMLFVQKFMGYKEDMDKVDKTLLMLGLENRHNYLPSSLSGGERRRAMIAVNILKDADLYLLDEPTNDLDIDWQVKVLELFYNLSEEGKAIVLVTHNKDCIKYGNRNYYLEEGYLNKINY